MLMKAARLLAKRTDGRTNGRMDERLNSVNSLDSLWSFFSFSNRNSNSADQPAVRGDDNSGGASVERQQQRPKRKLKSEQRQHQQKEKDWKGQYGRDRRAPLMGFCHLKRRRRRPAALTATARPTSHYLFIAGRLGCPSARGK